MGPGAAFPISFLCPQVLCRAANSLASSLGSRKCSPPGAWERLQFGKSAAAAGVCWLLMEIGQSAGTVVLPVFQHGGAVFYGLSRCSLESVSNRAWTSSGFPALGFWHAPVVEASQLLVPRLSSPQCSPGSISISSPCTGPGGQKSCLCPGSLLSLANLQQIQH